LITYHHNAKYVRREDQIEAEFGESTEDDSSEGIDKLKQDSLQTFVFSATLSKDLQRNLKKRARPKAKNRQAPASTLGMFAEMQNKEQ
jgi:ATP-dependent RNA helicase DDX24/MAK5